MRPNGVDVCVVVIDVVIDVVAVDDADEEADVVADVVLDDVCEVEAVLDCDVVAELDSDVVAVELCVLVFLQSGCFAPSGLGHHHQHMSTPHPW